MVSIDVRVVRSKETIQSAASWALLATLVLALPTGDTMARDLTLDERVAARRAIEQVQWNHRIWPKQNPGPKPPLSAVLTDDAIRAMVEDDLRKSHALASVWQTPITGKQLQAELDRMASRTRRPDVLREIHAALGNDPLLAAEALARPIVADRLIRNAYAFDDRFHGEIRRQAEAAVARAESVAAMKTMGGQYSERTIVRKRDARRLPSMAYGDRVVELDEGEWTEWVDLFAHRFRTRPDAIPVLTMSKLQEDPERFAVVAVLSRRDDDMVVASAVWPKQPFEAWWSAERQAMDASGETADESFTLEARERARSGNAATGRNGKAGAVPDRPVLEALRTERNGGFASCAGARLARCRGSS